jgi:hypothetical protein
MGPTLWVRPSTVIYPLLSTYRDFTMLTRSWSIQHPFQTLILAFILWKALLLLVAACSPDPGYDTSVSPSQAKASHFLNLLLPN